MKENYNSIKEEQEIWELDFFSRPVINDDGKKIWELIIVNKNLSIQHIETVPNSMVNSKELRKRLIKLIEKSQTKPKVIKFFRSQMYNMINIALSELDIIVKPSRRTYKLLDLISYREKMVYPTMDGYKPFMKEIDTNLNIKKTPEKLPDALRGEKFTFASLVTDQIKLIKASNPLFLDLGPLDLSNCEKEVIPGVIILSSRSKSLASWLNSVELFNISCDIEEKDLNLECGLDINYLVSKFIGNNIQEAKTFERSKLKADGLHFIAVQDLNGGNSIDGLWILNNK
jgi:hypothetical protein